MKDKVNMLFVCGYGVGSSAISEVIVKKALKELNINVELKHTAMGELVSYKDWADIIAISKKLVESVNLSDFKDKHVLEVVNIMDGKSIAGDVLKIVLEHYPDAKG